MFLKFFSLLLCCLVIFGQDAVSQLTGGREGRPVREFGVDGFVVLAPPEGDLPFVEGDSAILADGKIVTAYTATRKGISLILVTRILPNGQVDKTFGTEGRMILVGLVHHHAFDVAVQMDGKLLVAGMVQTQAGQPGFDFLLFRVTSDGQLDTSFSNNGVFKKNLALPGENSSDRIASIALQTDGKIVLGGIVDRFLPDPGYSLTSSAVIRLTADGTEDGSFGQGGVTLVPLGGNLRNVLDSLNEADVVVQTDGKIAIGATARGPGGFNTHIVRLLSDGTLDPQFAAGGIFATSTFTGGFQCLIELPDHKLLALSIPFNLRRLNPDGSIDDTFGYGGSIFINIGLADLAITDDGKIIAVGVQYVNTGSGSTQTWGVIRRFFANGQTDVRFGTLGIVRHKLVESNGLFRRLQILPDKTLLITGHGSQPDPVKAFVAKFYGTRKL